MAAELSLLKEGIFLFCADIIPHTSLIDSSTLLLAFCVYMCISVLALAHILLSVTGLVVFLDSLFCYTVSPELIPFILKHHTSQ